MGEMTGSAMKNMSPCDVAALKKCLEENKGDRTKCQSLVEDFKSACSAQKQTSASQASPKPS